MTKSCSTVVLLLVASFGFAQTPPANAPAAPAAAPASQVPDRASAYYHYSLAHMYEELVAMYGRAEFASKAAEEYRLALQSDPDSEFLNAGLAELYYKTGRIRDAVSEAEDIIKRDPKNLEARKLLGRIYLRSLGDVQAGAQSQDILHRAIEQYEAMVKLEPDNVDDHVLLGRLYRLNNDTAKAEAEFKTAVQLQPASEEAVTTLAYLYNEEGDTKRAAGLLNSLPEPARTAKVYSALAYTYEQQKDYKNAVAAYKKAVELDSDNLDSIRGLAQNLLNDGQMDAAAEQYKVIVDADPHDAQSYLRLADIYRRQGKYDQALDGLKKAQTEVSDSIEIPYNLAIIYQAQGKFDDAIQGLTGLLKKSEKADNSYTQNDKSNRGIFLERLGSIYKDTGKTPLAIETFRRMLVLGDDNAARGYQQIVEAYREAKNYPAALDAAKEAVSKVPGDRGLKLTLASQLVDQGHADVAFAQVKELLRGNADDREIYLTLAQMNSRLKRWTDAEDAAQQAEQLSAKNEDKAYADFVLASIYEREKKFDLAEDMFKKVIAWEPNNAVALNYLGYMLADRGIRLEEALGYVKRAIALDPQNGAYLDSLGWAYYKLGNFDLAEDNLRRAVDRSGSDPTILDHLGDLYNRTGRTKLAAAQWERALDEWNKSVDADVDTSTIAHVQKKLESARVRLAREQSAEKTETVKP